MSVILDVKVSPGASRNEITGFDGSGVLKIKVTAPPAEGRANQQLIKVLAKRLRTAKSSIRIVHGHSGRNKRIGIDDLTEGQVREKLREQE